MKILLIGGNGFIGSHVATTLLIQGHELGIFSRRSKTSHPYFYIQGLRDQLLTYHEKLLREFHPDLIIDFICYQQSEAEQSVKLANLCASSLVVISSIDVYQAFATLWRQQPNCVSLPLSENSPLRNNFYPMRAAAQSSGDWQYHYEKINVEHAISKAAQYPFLLLRLPAIVGINDPYGRMNDYFQAAKFSKTIHLNSDLAAWSFPRLCVENAASAIALAATSFKTNSTYNLPPDFSGTEYNWAKLFTEIYQATFQQTISVNVTPPEKAFPLNYQQSIIVDAKQFLADFNYQPIVSLSQSIHYLLKALADCKKTN